MPDQTPYPATLWDVFLELRDRHQRLARHVARRDAIDREIQAFEAEIASLEAMGLDAVREHAKAAEWATMPLHYLGPDNSLWRGCLGFNEIPIERSLDIKIPAVAVTTGPPTSMPVVVPAMDGEESLIASATWPKRSPQEPAGFLFPANGTEAAEFGPKAAANPVAEPSVNDRQATTIDQFCDTLEATQQPAARNTGRLTWTKGAEDFPLVGDTLIPASVIVGLIEGGMSPSSVQRLHPELTAADVTACIDWAEMVRRKPARNLAEAAI